MQGNVSDGDRQRLEALWRYRILDSGCEGAFDDLATLAAKICEVPIALVSFVDADRQWFKARVGLAACETPLEASFCSHAIRLDGLFVVPDATADPRFADNPLVVGEPAIRFYAGMPLTDPAGVSIGTLCVIDRVPRPGLTEEQADALGALARQVVGQLELRLQLGRLEESLADGRRMEASLRAAEARKAAVLEAALDAIISIDHEGKVVDYNPAAERIFGYTEAEAVGRSLADLIVPGELREAHRQGLARYLATGEGNVLGRRVEINGMRKGGETFPVELAITVVRQEGPPAFTAFLRDISERKQAEESLRESEERFALATLGSSDAFWFWEVSSGKVHYSPRFGELLETSGVELEPTVEAWTSRLHPEDRDRVLGQLSAHLEHRVPYDVEYRLRTDRGTYRTFRSRGQAVWDAEGRAVRMGGSNADVTAGRQAEAELSRRETEARRLALVASRTDNAVILTDAKGQIEWVNEGFTKITEYRLEDVVGKSPGAVLKGPETDPATSALMRARIANGEGFQVEVVNYAKSGRKYWIAAEVQPIRDEAGELVHFMAIESDITERKRADAQLRLLKAALDNANDAILVTEAEPVDQPGPRVIYANKAFTRTTGYTAEEILGQTPRILQGPGTDRATLDELRRKLKKWMAIRVELLNYRKDGSEFWVELNIRPVADEKGWYTHWVSVQRDITARKLAEEVERRESADALRESRELLRRVVTGAPVILFATDARGVVTLSEGSGLEALGLRAGESVGRSAFEAEPPSTLRAEDVCRALTGESFASVVEVSGLTFESRYTPLRGGDGAIVGVTGVATDITERTRAERQVRGLNDQLGRRLERIAALRRVDLTISGSLDLRVTLNTLLDQVTGHLGVHAAAVLLLDPATQALGTAMSQGLRKEATDRVKVRLGEGAAGRAALERRSVQVADLVSAEYPCRRSALLAEEGFTFSVAVPLVAKGYVKGVLEVYHREAIDADREWTDFLEALAGQAAIAIDSSALFEELQRSNAELTLAYDATIEGWSRALDLRDKETEGHTRRVTEMAVRLARSMGIEGRELVQVRRGALLHDIGKMGIPDAILLKPGPLTELERAVMQRHPTYAHDWLSPIPFLRPALEIPHCHHERWDGEGYPRGLRGDQIPIGARIFAAVDIWDALRSDRPYRDGWAEERVLDHIRLLSGNHLDPEIVRAFMDLLAEDRAGGEGDGISACDDPNCGGGEPCQGTCRLDLGPIDGERLRRAIESVRDLEARHGELHRTNARLVELSTTDDLTGLKNRRHFREALESTSSLAIREGLPLSLLMIDVDHFKEYNDAHGHPAGDEVLRRLASVFREQTRPGDVAARYGGEEFVVLAPGADDVEGLLLAERLLAEVARRAWPHRPITVSLGVATLSPTSPDGLALVAEADRALYHSKENGRGRATHHRDLLREPMLQGCP